MDKENVYHSLQIRYGWYSAKMRNAISQERRLGKDTGVYPAYQAFLAYGGTPVIISVHSETREKSGCYYDDVVYVGEIKGSIYPLEA